MSLEFGLLEIENFLSFKKESFDLHNQGLVLLLGSNLDAKKSDSNGSGKSSLLEAICWVIWGSTIKDIKADNVVSRKEKKNCKVTLNFKDSESAYTIIRHLKDKNHIKPNDLEFFVNGVQDIKSSMSITQELINKTVGMDFLTFRALMPGAGIKAADMTDKSIKNLLESLLHTEILADAHKVANDRLKAATVKLGTLTARLIRLQQDLAHQETIRTSYEEKNNTFEDNKRISIETALENISKLETELSSKEQTFSVGKARSDVDIKSITESIRKCDELAELTQTQINEVMETDKVICAMDKTRTSYEYKKEALEKSRANLAKADGVCPCCLQIVGEEHKEKSLHDLDKEILLCSNMLSVVNSRILNAKEVLDNKLQPLRDTRSLNTEKKNSLTKLLSKTENDSTILVRVSSIEIGNLNTKIQELNKFLDTQQNLENPFSSLLASNSQDLDKIRNEITTLESEVTALKTEEENLAFWVDGFGTHGIRSYMLRKVTPLLNERAAHYSEVITGGEMKLTFQTEKELKNGNTVEEFSISVDQENGGEVYGSLSGGEKGRADLIISLVLGDLASLRASKKLPFRFIDEAFEKIDETGLESIVSFLNSQSQEYSSIFVVTHKSELQQYFNKTIKVQKKGGVSTIV